MKAHKTLSPQEARAALRTKGLSIRKWAVSNGLSVEVVRAVLNGKSKCTIGQSHKVAVLLGIKEGEIVD